MGAVDYVFKPVDPVILRSKVAVLVDLYQQERGGGAQGRARTLPAGRELPHPPGEARSRAAAAAGRRAAGRHRALAAASRCTALRIDSGFCGAALHQRRDRRFDRLPAAFVSRRPAAVGRPYSSRRPNRMLNEVAMIPTLGGMSTEYRWVWRRRLTSLVPRSRGVESSGRPAVRNPSAAVWMSPIAVSVEQQLIQSQKMEAAWSTDRRHRARLQQHADGRDRHSRLCWLAN